MYVIYTYIWFVFRSMVLIPSPPGILPGLLIFFFLLGGLFPTSGPAKRDNSLPLWTLHKPQICGIVYKIETRIVNFMQ